MVLWTIDFLDVFAIRLLIFTVLNALINSLIWKMFQMTISDIEEHLKHHNVLGQQIF